MQRALTDASPVYLVQALKLATDPKIELTDQMRRIAIPRLLHGNFDPHVRIAAVEAMAARPHADFVIPLVELLKSVSADDTHLPPRSAAWRCGIACAT